MLGKRDNRKVLAIMLVLLTVASTGLFADSLQDMVKHVATYVFGYVLGGLLLIKFGLDLLQAFWKRDQDPAAVKKAVIGFVIALAVVLLWNPLLGYVLGAGGFEATTDDPYTFLKGLGVTPKK